MKKIILLALILTGLTAAAQTITFDTNDYKAIGVYDTWAESPFRTNQLEGNAAVITNHLNQIDDVLGEAPNPSSNIVGLQRSRYGSNTYGLRVDLNEPFRLTKEPRYVHVLVYKPVESRMLICGLGKRTESAWSWQDGNCEQFKVATATKVKANTWVDVVVPINGFSYADPTKDGIDIQSLVICPDLRSMQNGEEDFICYIDQIEINDNPSPRFTTQMYAINFDPEEKVTRSDRHLDGVGLAQQTVSGLGAKHYNDLTTTAIFGAKAGKSVTPTFSFTGNWMSGYIYVDWGNDGKFSYNIQTNGRPAAGSDVVSYCAYNPNEATGEGPASWLKSNGTTASNGNTIGSAMPSFTIPANTPNGFYRMRYKVDWNCIDPAGNAAPNNLIVNNGGGIADVLLDIHPDQIRVSEGSLNGQMLTASGQPLDNVYTTYGQPYTVKIDPYPGFSHDGVIIRSGYNTASDEQFVNENPQYIINKFSYDDFDDNGLLTIPASMMIGGEVLIEGQFIEALKTPYTVLIKGADNGGVTFKGINYANGDKITTDHLINPDKLTILPVAGFNNNTIAIEGMTITVTYDNGPVKGDTITALSQLSNTKAYFITSFTGEGTLVYNPTITSNYVSIKASNGCVQGFPGNNSAKTAYQSETDPFSLNDSWQILQKSNKYYLYNPGAKKFVILSGRDYVFTNTETALSEIRTNSASETTSINGTSRSIGGSFSFLGLGGGNQYYACICTNTTPQAVRNWTYNDHGSVFYIIENPNIEVTDIFDELSALVSPVDASIQRGEDSIFDLHGNRLKALPRKGFAIINGRKVKL